MSRIGNLRDAALAGFAAAALSIPSPLVAQVRMSERGTVSQVLDGATITVDYARPVARGRELFGKLVRWGEVWTPGANWATTLEADRDIRLNGQPVPKGKYAVWMIPRQSGDWTLFLALPARHFHVPAVDSASARYSVAVTPEQRASAPEDVLTWSFPSVGPDAATLRFQWGTTAVPIRLSVQPTRLAVVPVEERATYVGDYTFTRLNGTPGRAHFADEAGTLRVHQDSKVYGVYDDYFDLIPDGPRRFKRALYKDGKLVEVESEITYVFEVTGNRATGYRLLGANDVPILHGDRVKAGTTAERP